MNACKVLPWPAKEAVLTLRCVECRRLFDAYPGDEALLQESLCPACFIQNRYPKDLRACDKCFWWGLAIIACCAVAGFVWMIR
jgi:hypothetical protein